MTMGSSQDLFTGIVPFYHVARAKSFRQAGAALGLTPAAMSKAVLKLEGQLGVRLLVRTSRSVSLTADGEAFFARCHDAITSMEAAREMVSKSRRQPRGEVHLTLPFILARRVMAALPRLAERHPMMSYRLTITDRLLNHVESRVDVGLRIGASTDAGLVVKRLRSTRWVTVASPSYLARHGTPASIDDLQRHNTLRFVAPDGRARVWTFVGPDGEPVRVSTQGNLLVDHGEHLLDAAESGLGIAQVLDFMLVGSRGAPSPLRDGRLVEVLSDVAAVGPDLSAVHLPERRSSPNVRALVAFLADVLDPARPEISRS